VMSAVGKLTNAATGIRATDGEEDEDADTPEMAAGVAAHPWSISGTSPVCPA